MSKITITKLKKKLMTLVKNRVKLRDGFTCQHCDKMVEGSNCQASHVIPVSAGNALAFDEQNLKVLCYHCHLNWWHKNPVESGDWFKNKFPDRWEYLQSHKNDIVHWKLHDYQKMIEDLS
jgi:5-methylcytosine-specific restriction endonuclease McrA